MNSGAMRSEKELGLDNKFIIGHAGHLAAVKNQSFLLSLMPEILKRQPQAYLLLLGEGEDRPILEQKIHELHFGRPCPHDRKCPQCAGLPERDGRFRFPVTL